jgi:iron complex transport system substrate-binding protein
MRVVSLIASATETVCALGCEGWLVGRSHECDFPPAVRALPACTEPKFDVSGSSVEIDRRVKDALRESASVYRVFAEVLDELAPDVIVTQAHCDVCAVSLRDVEEAASKMVRSRPRVVALMPNTLADVLDGIRRVADALGVPDRGRRLVADVQARMNAVAERVARQEARPTIACIEWIEPLMAAGNWMPELVAMAGGTNLFGEAGAHSPFFAWDDLRRADPDAIVVLPCGFDIPRTRAELPTLTAKLGWADLTAVRTGRVFVGDGNAFFNRPGPRLVESLELLAGVLHPEVFPLGQEGIEAV